MALRRSYGDVVTDAISCDPAAMVADLAAPARDPWLERRKLVWGASEMPILFAARGWLSAEALTQAQRDEMELAKVGAARGVPKYLARKAGLMRDRKGQSQEHTARVEQELLSVWKRTYADHYGVEPESVRHASEWPIEWQPMPDRECEFLGATWDAYGRDMYDGSIVGIELKAPPTFEAWGKWGLRWSAQVHAQNGVLGYARSLVVVGNGWAIQDAAGPVTTHEVMRDEREIERCRDAARDAMAAVVRLRAQKGE